MTNEQPHIIKKKRHPLWRRLALQAIATGTAIRAARGRIPVMNETTRHTVLRRPEVGSPCILAAADDVYFENFAIPLILSCALNAPESQIHIVLIRPAQQTLDRIDALAKTLTPFRVSWSMDESPVPDELAIKAIYYTSARFVFLPTLLDLCEASVFCMDVDALVLKDIWPVYEAARGTSDVQLYARNERSASRRFMAGAIGVEPTADGKLFARALREALLPAFRLKPRYHVDQIQMNFLLQTLDRLHPIARSQIPVSLCDYEFDAGSAIWTAKGWAIKNSDQFQNALASVMERARARFDYQDKTHESA